MSVTTAPANGWHWREWYAEFAGTALLLFAVVTAKDWVIRAGPPFSDLWLRVAIVGAVAGLVVILVACSPLGRRSGAHLNPVVTLGLSAQRIVGRADLLGYTVGQVAGGILGVALAGIWGPSVSGPDVRWAVIAPATWLGQPTAAVIEASATAVQLGVVFACLASARRAHFAPLAAGVLLTAAIAGLGPISGAGFNPVRALAPDVLAGAYPALWIYVAGPVAGSVAAAVAVLRWAGRPRTGKLVHAPEIACHMRCELPHSVGTQKDLACRSEAAALADEISPGRDR